MCLLLPACGPRVPDTANGILDLWEADGLVTCTERREPVPDVVTCEDAEGGDLTVGLTETGLDTVRSTAATTDGPWIVGDTFVVITYDEDPARVRALRDLLGSGQLYSVDEDDEPRVLPDP
ncbi:MAG TPA: hypothetical protein VMM13_14480 [Euzebya sp.]|nr:hypothetical protein [Euzebya sp.]